MCLQIELQDIGSCQLLRKFRFNDCILLTEKSLEWKLKLLDSSILQWSLKKQICSNNHVSNPLPQAFVLESYKPPLLDLFLTFWGFFSLIDWVRKNSFQKNVPNRRPLISLSHLHTLIVDPVESLRNIPVKICNFWLNAGC